MPILESEEIRTKKRLEIEQYLASSKLTKRPI